MTIKKHKLPNHYQRSKGIRSAYRLTINGITFEKIINMPVSKVIDKQLGRLRQ